MKVLSAAVRAAEQGIPAALVTVVGINGSAPRSAGTRMLVYHTGDFVGTVGGGEWERRLLAEAQAVIAAGTPRRFTVHLTRDLGMCCGGAMDAFIEPLIRPEHMVIYGAGHVGTATARMARDLGFRTLVVDDREEWNNPERLDGVEILCADPLRVLDQLPFGERCYHFVVTHSHQLDQALLERLLPRQVAWLGMIGSRAKVARFLVRLRAAGVDESLFRRLSAPVGLDIGAETPEEIAVSVLAEVVRVRRGCTRPPEPMSQQPLRARGGSVVGEAPGLGTMQEE